ncbi:hypothetical protein [Streptomyces hyaluromycini]|uniref:hypothetical protein n=1 Tax=Streptomyces hyaluromycini TaxID=1377993 RepID=UPI000B5C4C20|nr:hypothetical protein [Streptomyces hyaluromycini]
MRLSADEVQELRVEGPPWLSQEHQQVAVEIRPLAHLPESEHEVDLVPTDEEGHPVSSFVAALKAAGEGSRGRSVEVHVDRGLALRLLLPHDDTQPANLLCTFQSDGLTAADPLRQLELRRLLSGPGYLAVEVDGHPVISGRLPKAPDDDPAQLADFDALASYIEDLDIGQRHTRQYFPVDLDIPTAASPSRSTAPTIPSCAAPSAGPAA